MEPEAQNIERILRDLSRLGWSLMRRFSAIYAPADVISAVTGLSPAEFRQLSSLHYLGSREVANFLNRWAPGFASAMPVSMELAVREDRSFPKGRIDWTRTCRTRLHRGGDKSFFVSRAPERSRDTSAARLVAYLLNDLAGASAQMIGEAIPEVARETLVRHRAQAEATLRTLTGRGVTVPRSARVRDFAHLRRSRNPAIFRATELLELRQSILGSNGEERLRTIMSQALFAPEKLDDLFEAWTLLQLVNLHLEQGWSLASARLVGGLTSKRPHFIMKRDDDTVELFYQTVAEPLGTSSVYKELFSSYDLDVSLRRPDIIAKVKCTAFQGPLIVEVKRSADRTYIADAVYKVLGYLGDYAAHFGGSRPKALLVVAGGIGTPATYPADADLWIIPEQRLRSFQLPY